MKKILSALVFSSFIVLFACEKKVGKEPVAQTQNTVTVSSCDTITYDRNIKSIYDSQCASCHKTGGVGPDLSTYSAFKAIALNGKLKARTMDAADGSSALMPQGGPRLPQSQLSLIQCWINNGAKEK